MKRRDKRVLNKLSPWYKKNKNMNRIENLHRYTSLVD